MTQFGVKNEGPVGALRPPDIFPESDNDTPPHEERSQQECSAALPGRSHLSSTSLFPATEGALRLGDLQWISGYAFSGRTS